MNYGFIRLEWQVPKKGYRIALRPRSKPGRSIMTGKDEGRGYYLEPIGDEVRAYSKGLMEDFLFYQLAEMDASAEGVLAFANKWGVLEKGDNTVESIIWQRQQIRAAIGTVMTDGLSALAKRLQPKTHIRALDVGFRKVPRQSAPEICYYVRDLRAFCWLEMYQALAGPTDIMQCKRCKTLMRRQKTGPDPEYCSDACKQAVYRQRMKLRAAKSS